MSAPRFLILADRDFGPLTSKTANSIIRYLPDRTVAVLDSQLVGKTAQDVLGFGDEGGEPCGIDGGVCFDHDLGVSDAGVAS